jgi:hypothetical protein
MHRSSAFVYIQTRSTKIMLTQSEFLELQLTQIELLLIFLLYLFPNSTARLQPVTVEETSINSTNIKQRHFQCGALYQSYEVQRL